MGFVPQLEDFPSLAGQVGTGIQRPNGLVRDLQTKNKEKEVMRGLLHLACLLTSRGWTANTRTGIISGLFQYLPWAVLYLGAVKQTRQFFQGFT